ncbi:MAG: hypothetical protein ACTIA6_02995 [Pseudoclavibacter sp.]
MEFFIVFDRESVRRLTFSVYPDKRFYTGHAHEPLSLFQLPVRVDCVRSTLNWGERPLRIALTKSSQIHPETITNVALLGIPGALVTSTN